MSTLPKENDLTEQCTTLLKKYLTAFDSLVSNFVGLKTFKPEADDVVIASFLKSGTTLTQQMVYQIMVVTGRVPSDPLGNDFEDISMVVPYIEMGPASGVFQSIHPYTPRMWKSHSTVEEFASFPETTRYIYCVRNGMHIAPSMLDFTLDWIVNEPVGGEEIRKAFYPLWFLNKFLGIELKEDGSYTKTGDAQWNWFEHVKGWKVSKNKNIFFLIYEDVVRDMSGTVRRIADFLGIELSEEQVETVAARCDRKAMTGDPRYRDVLVSRLMGWDEEGGVRVRPADAPGFKHVALPEYCKEAYQKLFEETFDLKEYNDLVAHLRARTNGIAA